MDPLGDLGEWLKHLPLKRRMPFMYHKPTGFASESVGIALAMKPAKPATFDIGPRCIRNLSSPINPPFRRPRQALVVPLQRESPLKDKDNSTHNLTDSTSSGERVIESSHEEFERVVIINMRRKRKPRSPDSQLSAVYSSEAPVPSEENPPAEVKLYQSFETTISPPTPKVRRVSLFLPRPASPLIDAVGHSSEGSSSQPKERLPLRLEVAGGQTRFEQVHEEDEALLWSSFVSTLELHDGDCDDDAPTQQNQARAGRIHGRKALQVAFHQLTQSLVEE